MKFFSSSMTPIFVTIVQGYTNQLQFIPPHARLHHEAKRGCIEIGACPPQGPPFASKVSERRENACAGPEMIRLRMEVDSKRESSRISCSPVASDQTIRLQIASDRPIVPLPRPQFANKGFLLREKSVIEV